MMALVLLGLAGPAAAADNKSPEVRIAARAVPSADGSFTVLWEMEPSAPWHIYSDRLNDSGFKPALKIAWPAGWQAGKLAWPVAERHLLDGIILDHVYHGPVTLVQEVSPAAGAFAQGPVTLEARWDWLACHELCVPGHTETRVVFSPVDEGGAADVIAARARLSRPLGENEVTVHWGEGLVHFTAVGAASLEFHPAGDGSGVRFTDLPADGVAQGEELTLRLRPGDDGFGHLRGTLLINQDDGSAQYRTVDIPYGGK